MGGLDACAHRAASDAQTLARMVNAARDNVFTIIIPLLLDYSILTWCARIILLPTSPRARRLADCSRVGRRYGSTRWLLCLFVPACSHRDLHV